MPAVMQPALASNHSSSSLSAVARGKKRARFADDEDPTATTVLRSTSLPAVPMLSGQQDDDTPRKVIKNGRSGSNAAAALASVHGAMRKEMYAAFIERAFSEKYLGRMDRYHELLAQFQHLAEPGAASARSTAPTSPQMQLWLSALNGVVSRLDRSHATLVNTVINLPWTVMDDAFVGAYVRFVCSLVSARGEWTKTVVDKTVRGFQYRSIPLELRSGGLPVDVTRRTVYNRLHTLLRTLLALIPTLPSILWPLLESHFPTKRDHRDAHVCYISNMLRVMLYCPTLEENILEAVVGRAIKLDVEIQGEVEDWEDEDGHLETEIFGKSIEDAFDKAWCEEEASEDEEGGVLIDEPLTFDDISSDEGGLTDEEDVKPAGPDETAVRKVKEMAAKLDAILRCLFDHLQRANSSASPTMFSPPHTPLPAPGPDSAAYASTFSALPPTLFDPESDEGHVVRKNLFEVLLGIFERTILRTRRTRHTQFVLFWYASLHPDFTDRFLGSLVEAALFDDETPVTTRLAAIGYVASLIGRAKYIDRATSRHVVTLLCTRLEADLDRFGPASAVDATGTAQQFALWYAIAQAAFYIFCFRWKDLMEGDDDEDEDPMFAVRAGRGRWLPALNFLQRAVSSHLNPLKACAPTVVAQFAKISQQTDFLYCYSIIRANERGAGAAAFFNQADRTSTPSSEGDLASSKSSLHKVAGAKAAVPPPTANPLVRDVLAEAKMDSFFPFDPYKLPLTTPYLEHIFRVWEGGPQDRQEDDEFDSDSDESDEPDHEAAGTTENDSPPTQPIPLAKPTPSTEAEKLDTTFLAMSISPQAPIAQAA